MQDNNDRDMIHSTHPSGPAIKNEHEVLLHRIIGLAIRGLENMFDVEKGLFCYRTRQTPDGIIKEGFSRRYTIISLLGLHRYESQGGRSSIGIKNSLETLVGDVERINNIGDLGLLLWLCALASPGLLSQVLDTLDLNECILKYPDAVQGRTMELAWFLTGLSYTGLIDGNYSKSSRDLVNKVYNIIRSNYGGKGIFGHMEKTTLVGLIRGRIGSFADQVYPIYAFTKYAKAFGHNEALEIALECATTICAHQGSLGQWWWHYDSHSGRMVGQYPVYSVHQDGMAPMALFAVSEASKSDFNEAVYRGLEWIAGKNELGVSLIDISNKIIWRSFYRNKFKRFGHEGLSLIGSDNKWGESDDLMVLHECRPYHLGWILYAFADKFINEV